MIDEFDGKNIGNKVIETRLFNKHNFGF